MVEKGTENRITVGIIHDEEDVTDVIRAFSEAAGFFTASKNLEDVTKDPNFPREYLIFLKSFNPDLIVFGVPYPYKDNWQRLNRLITLDESKGRQFLLTTTNKLEVEQLAGKTGLEILEEPFTIDSLDSAIHKLHRSLLLRRTGNGSLLNSNNTDPGMQNADGI